MPGPAELPEGGDPGPGRPPWWWWFRPQPDPAELPAVDTGPSPIVLDELVKLRNRVHALETEVMTFKFAGLAGSQASASAARGRPTGVPGEIAEIVPPEIGEAEIAEFPPPEIGEAEIAEIVPPEIDEAEIAELPPNIPDEVLRQLIAVIDRRAATLLKPIRAELAALDERVKNLEQRG